MRSLRSVTLLLVIVSWMVLPSSAQQFCQTDLGFASPGGGDLTVCGQKLTAGNSAALMFTGGPACAMATLLLGTSSNPTPYAGGILVLDSPTPFPIQLDGNGSYVLTPPIAGGSGPATTVAQVVVNVAGTLEFSNAVQIYYLPDNRPTVKIVFALPYYSNGTWERSKAEAEAMRDGLIETFERNSYDQFDLDIHISDPFMMDDPIKSYGSGDSVYKISREVVEKPDPVPGLLAGMDYLVTHSDQKAFSPNMNKNGFGVGARYVVMADRWDEKVSLRCGVP